MFTSACYLSLSCARSIQSIPPHPTSWPSILLSSHKGSFQAQGTGIRFITRPVFVVTFVRTTPNPQAGGPPLVGCPWLLIQCIHSYPPYWSLFLHVQPKDAPCWGDRDPLIMATWLTYIKVVCVWQVTVHKPTKQLNKLSGWPWARWPGFDPCQGLLPWHPEQL
jgi:hypothetical protein